MIRYLLEKEEFDKVKEYLEYGGYEDSLYIDVFSKFMDTNKDDKYEEIIECAQQIKQNIDLKNYFIGKAYFKLEKYEEAFKYLKRGIEEHKFKEYKDIEEYLYFYGDLYYYYSLIFKMKNDNLEDKEYVQKSEFYFNKFKKIVKESFLGNLGEDSTICLINRDLLNLDELPNKEEILEENKNLNQNIDECYTKVLDYYLKQDYERVESILEEAIKNVNQSNEHYIRFFEYLCDVYIKLNKFEKAENIITEFLKENNKSKKMYNLIEELYKKLSKDKFEKLSNLVKKIEEHFKQLKQHHNEELLIISIKNILIEFKNSEHSQFY